MLSRRFIQFNARVVKNLSFHKTGAVEVAFNRIYNNDKYQPWSQMTVRNMNIVTDAIGGIAKKVAQSSKGKRNPVLPSINFLLNLSN